LSEETRKWMTEVRGTFGGDEGVYLGIISEWKTDDAGRINYAYFTTTKFRKLNTNQIGISLNNSKDYHISLDAAGI